MREETLHLSAAIEALRSDYLRQPSQPLRIVCHVRATTRKAGDPYHSLDGILSYAVATKITDGKPYLLQGLSAVSMPLPILTIEGLPICSVLRPTSETHSAIGWALRRPRDGWQTTGGRGMFAKVDERGGPDQPRRVPIAVHLSLRYEALCIGHLESIEELLDGITHIGPRADIGYGEVDRWEVVPCNATVAEVLTTKEHGESVLARAVPVHLGELLSEYGISADPQDAGFGGWRPPYWHHEGYTERWTFQTPVTVSEVVLC